jgi:hypothetical protein
MSSLPENINFGDPNAHPNNFPPFGYPNQPTESIDQKNISDNDNKNKNTSQESTELNDKIINFLKIKTTTILTFAIAVAIGFGIKDFINSMVINILQPSLVTLILTLDKNDYLPITASLREKNLQIDISKFLGSLLVLKLVVGSSYLMYVYTNILSPLKII